MVVVLSNRIPVANLPGFIRTDVLKPVKGDHYIVVTHWQSMKDFENWTNSNSFMESHANAPPHDPFAGPSQLEIHEIIAER